MFIKKYSAKIKKMLFFLPSLITCSSILCGLWAIFICFTSGKIELAILFIVLSGILDAFDGRTARLLGVAGKFGVELDSLADFLSFGVAPMIIFYHSYTWANEINSFAILSMFPTCMALRLARFNMLALEPVGGNKTLIEFRKNFFFGLAAPIGAMVLLLPVITNILNIFNFNCSCFALIYSFIVALLLVIPIPMPSVKLLHIGFAKKRDAIFTMLLMIYGCTFVYYPMYCLILLILAYLCTIPIFTIYYHYKKAKIMEISDIKKITTKIQKAVKHVVKKPKFKKPIKTFKRKQDHK